MVVSGDNSEPLPIHNAPPRARVRSQTDWRIILGRRNINALDDQFLPNSKPIQHHKFEVSSVRACHCDDCSRRFSTLCFLRFDRCHQKYFTVQYSQLTCRSRFPHIPLAVDGQSEPRDGQNRLFLRRQIRKQQMNNGASRSVSFIWLLLNGDARMPMSFSICTKWGSLNRSIVALHGCEHGSGYHVVSTHRPPHFPSTRNRMQTTKGRRPSVPLQRRGTLCIRQMSRSTTFSEILLPLGS